MRLLPNYVVTEMSVTIQFPQIQCGACLVTAGQTQQRRIRQGSF